MGGALLSSWIDASILQPRNVAILDPSPGVDAVYTIERGAKHLSDSTEIARTVDTVLLAIKPQLFDGMKAEMAKAVPDGTLVISIMAGVSSQSLKAAFPDCQTIRAMPNTPVSVGRGMTAYLADEDTDTQTIETVEALFSASGDVARVVDDGQIDAVTAISGSGPAYVFHFVEALANAAQSLGIDPDMAMELARGTLTGAAALLEASENDAQELRDAVTSPGGTTQAGLDVLMAPDGLTQLMRATTRAANRRARELSR